MNDMIWLTWHTVKDMIKDVRNDMTKWYDMKKRVGLYYMMMKMDKCWDLMHYFVLMHRGIPLLLHDSTDAYGTRQETIIMFIIMLPWRSLFLTNVWHQQLLENTRPTRKVSKRCVSWVVSLYSHMWTVCREIKYTSNCLFRIAKIDSYDKSHSWNYILLHLTLIGVSLMEYFL